MLQRLVLFQLQVFGTFFCLQSETVGVCAEPTTWLLEAPPLAGSTWWPDKGGTNPHDDPTLIAPKRGSARVGLGLGLGAGGGDALALPPFAYLVAEYRRG